MPKLLIGAGVVLIFVGLAWLVGERFGLGRLVVDGETIELRSKMP